MEIVRDTPFEVGFTTFQLRPPQNALIVAVKATYDLRSDGPCTVAAEQHPVSPDLYEDEDPANELRYPSDLALVKPRGEYFVLGTCYPPGGTARTAAVAFRVGALQKALAVFGDRHWGSGLDRGASEPAPFTSMPLRWTRAFGGARVEANPVGLGTAPVATASGSRVPLPNIEHPQQLVTNPGDRVAPTGCGPLSPTWLPRKALQGTYDARWQKLRWPWYPEDLSLEFFNAAPRDQLLPLRSYWRGDEELALKFLHAERQIVNTRLPGQRARVFVVPKAGGFVEVPLQLDTIVVNADAWVVHCVWRGHVEVGDLRARDIALLFAAHEELHEGHPEQHWRDRLAALQAEPAEPAPPPAPPPEAPPGPPPADAPDELDEIRAKMVEVGMLPATPEPLEPPAPIDPAVTVQMAEAIGMSETGELRALLEEAAREPPPPEPPPAAPELRAVVIEKHARGESLSGLDLTAADLSSLDLTGADFSGAILERASFFNSIVRQAKFNEAQLGEANLSRAAFEDSDFTAADMTAIEGRASLFDRCVFEDAIVERALLVGSSFVELRGARAKLTQTNLQQSLLPKADLTAADLSATLLDDVDFTEAKLPLANLRGAVGARAKFDECDLTEVRAGEGARLTECTMRYAKAPAGAFAGGDYNKSNFSFSDMDGADFSGARLVQARFDGCSLVGANFEEAALVGATAVQANLAEAGLEGADLSHADLRGANLHAAALWRAKVDFVERANAIVTRTMFEERG